MRDAQASGHRLTVDLDGAVGYASSFLEEAFGGLVRERGFSSQEVAALLIVRAGPVFESYRELILKYVREAKPRAAN
jgi:hypothetical protein